VGIIIDSCEHAEEVIHCIWSSALYMEMVVFMVVNESKSPRNFVDWENRMYMSVLFRFER
jgi:hypothetical protein